MAAFFDSGFWNAGTPSLIASTPVNAVQPAANARSSRKNEIDWSPAISCGVSGRGACLHGALFVARSPQRPGSDSRDVVAYSVVRGGRPRRRRSIPQRTSAVRMTFLRIQLPQSRVSTTVGQGRGGGGVFHQSYRCRIRAFYAQTNAPTYEFRTNPFQQEHALLLSPSGLYHSSIAQTCFAAVSATETPLDCSRACFAFSMRE